MARPAPGPEINLGDDLELVELLERRETLYREIRAGQRELEQIRAILAARLGEATYGRVANWEIFWSESNYRPQPARIMRALWARRIGVTRRFVQNRTLSCLGQERSANVA
jgi:hypothetical protein